MPGRMIPRFSSWSKPTSTSSARLRELAVKYRRATSDDRSKLKKQLEDLVAKHFDVRQQRRALELKRLETELQRLREAMERRQKAREKLIGERVTDLVGHEEEPAF